MERGGKNKGGYVGCKEQMDEGEECEKNLGLKGYLDHCSSSLLSHSGYSCFLVLLLGFHR